MNIKNPVKNDDKWAIIKLEKNFQLRFMFANENWKKILKTNFASYLASSLQKETLLHRLLVFPERWLNVQQLGNVASCCW